MSHIEEQILQRASELEEKSDILTVGLLSLPQYQSSARASMLTQHLVQATIPDNPDIPAVSTGWEHLFGHYSNSYKKTDTNIEIVHKIRKFRDSDMNYILVVYDKKKKEYDIIKRQETKNLAEYFGFRYKNSNIDAFQEGDVISKGTMLYHSPTLDEHENYMYGLNANVVYVINQGCIEDATRVSEQFAERASFTKVDSCRIPLNDNDIPLNIYGKNGEYKAFADIGETTKNSTIFVSRRKDSKTSHYATKNSNLSKIFPNDDVFQTLGDWQIVDINMWCNKKSLDEIPDADTHKQIKKYYEQILDYNNEIYRILKDIIDTSEEFGHTYSTELSRLYATVRDYLDPNCKFSENDRMFSNMIIEFTFAKSEPLRPGSKITGRCGNKSVVGEVVSQEELGYTADGKPIDVQIDALSVIGRLNTTQSFDQELNWLGDSVKQRIATADDNNTKFNILFEFLKACKHDDYYLALCDDYYSRDEEGKTEFFDEIINDRIYIMQKPMEAVTGDDLRDMYATFEPKLSDIYVADEDGEFKLRRKAIVAEEYMLILKHLGSSKFSVRGKSMINPKTSLPSKSLKAKKKKILFADQAIRVGEQEVNVLMISNNSVALDYFYRYYASSVGARRDDGLFIQDPLEGDEINSEYDRSRTVDILSAYLKAMGYRLVIDYDDYNEEPEVEADEKLEIPEYIRDLFTE